MNLTFRFIQFLTFGLFIAGCNPAEQPLDQISTKAIIESSGFDRLSGSEYFTMLISGTRVGQMSSVHDDITSVEYEFRNNGRGPTIHEKIVFDEDGFPVNWSLSGNTSFGNKFEENFSIEDGQASWTDSTGQGTAALSNKNLYVAQQAAPYALWVYARLLLADDDRTMPILPAGELRLEEMEVVSVNGPSGPETITTYALYGIDLNPSYIALDASGKLFANMSPVFALVREGYESIEQKLRNLTVEYSAKRYEIIQEKVTRKFDRPIRINNVRLFDPHTLSLTDFSSVLIVGNRIAGVDAVQSQLDNDEVHIDGNGGTLVAGMYEMHMHLRDDRALLNIAAGVTSVRDMGNINDVLSELIANIESGRLVGPRVTRSGFIEGASPFNSNNGILVSSEEEAVDAVRQYASGDIGNYHQIKIYNSMKPEWVPAVIAEARLHGLRVAGHVPAFTNADAMISAGYDEMTHINQVMLAWVLNEGEDTRTLLRLTALTRLPDLNISDLAVQNTINAMVERNVAIDPTLAIHEQLLLSRNGTTAQGALDYIEHMPIGAQRAAKSAMAEISTPEDDEAYRLAYDKIIETLAEMYRRGVFIIPGTDMGGSFPYHRELELYQQVGMTPGEILKMATYDMAAYLEQDEELGSIESGKLADFFLVPGDPTTDLKAIKTIAMVVKDGVVFFPSEIYPEFGILPFIDVPDIIQTNGTE